MNKYYRPLLILLIAFTFALSGCFGSHFSGPEETVPPNQDDHTEQPSNSNELGDQSGHQNGSGMKEHDIVQQDPENQTGGQSNSENEAEEDQTSKNNDTSNAEHEQDKTDDHKATEPEHKEPKPEDPGLSIWDVVKNMTLDEKIGQLVMFGIDGTQLGSHTKTLIRDYHVGGIILYGKNIQTTGQTVRLLNQLKTINNQADNPLPLFLSVDQEGGRVERMPDAIAGLPSQGRIGDVGDPEFSRQIGRLIGTELRAFGFNMDFAPVLDVIRDSETSVIGDRSFGSDPQLVSKLGVAEMKGIASQNVIPVVKHFPGYGEVSTNAHTGLPVANVGLERLQNVDWVPYKKAIANGADAVMVTHILLSKLDTRYPASMSQKIITGMLRHKLGFNGVVITDDMTMGAIQKNYDLDRSAVRAVKAGADIVLVAFNYDQQISVLHALKQAVKNGEISKKRLNQSVSRILRLKRKYELSNQAKNEVDVDQLNDHIRSVLGGK